MNHLIRFDYRLLISHISSWNYQAVQIIEYSRKAQIHSQEEVIQFVQLILRHIFKFREDKSNNVFREIRKCFRKTAKFEFFAKQIIYLESPDHVLQNDV